ncbi:helix-turn-helix domain-containing protein [Streptomyces albus]|uniref:helix-turn-helix domain-containing protein n=1 Tax=Streptomyces sp. PHES57 TaxID=2872626 RepID=UPI0027DF556F|nr:helix-turn-helix domain-containing protein [Streptomyces sp. PHES57]
MGAPPAGAPVHGRAGRRTGRPPRPHGHLAPGLRGRRPAPAGRPAGAVRSAGPAGPARARPPRRRVRRGGLAAAGGAQQDAALPALRAAAAAGPRLSGRCRPRPARRSVRPVPRRSRTSRTHRVADYAAALGYSTRTLTRATRAATGTTAKNYLDTRILLEAKRLLVHTDAGSADIARRLGFGDPGDFGKFFRRLDGRTPLAFRAQARGTPGR